MKEYFSWTGMLPRDFSGGRSSIPFQNLISSKYPSWNFTPFTFASFSEGNICSDQLLPLLAELMWKASLLNNRWLNFIYLVMNIHSLMFIFTGSVWYGAKNHLVIKHHIWAKKRLVKLLCSLKNRVHCGVCWFQWRQVEARQKMVGKMGNWSERCWLLCFCHQKWSESKSNSQTSDCKGRWKVIHLASFSLVGKIMDCQRCLHLNPQNLWLHYLTGQKGF